MKAILPVLWILKNASWRLSVVFSNLEYRIINTIDNIDIHYADKRWAQMVNKNNNNKGVK